MMPGERQQTRYPPTQQGGQQTLWQMLRHLLPAGVPVWVPVPVHVRWPYGLLVAGLALSSLWFLAAAGVTAGKAWLAPVLIERAWQETLLNGQAVKPWPWADTYPVAKISVPELGVERFVMAGADMRALAFGPVSLMGEKPILFGHRDTHFRFLKDLSLGARIQLIDKRGEASWFVVEAVWQAHKDALYAPGSRLSNSLLLVTCYPFEGLDYRTDMRHLVWAVAEEG